MDSNLQPLGKMLMVAGALLFVLGLGLYLGWRWLGRLPGDIHVQRPGFSFHFPLATSLLLSLLLSLVLYLLNRRG